MTETQREREIEAEAKDIHEAMSGIQVARADLDFKYERFREAIGRLQEESEAIRISKKKVEK